MKRMLFNATQAEELRVAIVDGQRLIDLDIESAAKEQKKSNIYKAVITRIEPSLEAAFVDYGSERHGFLPFKEISRSYFQPGIEPNKASIREALKEGQELIVQVDKDERGNKGAALTTFVSLAGRYLVLMPNNPRGGGVSRRVEGDERAELREAMDQLDVPQGMSLIARTAAIGRTAEELQWDLNYLLQLWKAIEGAATLQNGAFLIYQEGSLVIRAIRDYFQPDIGEILIDTDEVHEQAKQFMEHVMPTTVNRIKRYSDDVPLFSRFQIEHQIESAYSRQVNLPSGGAIVIDHTEALVAIDVNSGRSTRGADIEETAFKTNLEAAEEISRQLRLRDLGGLIIIDFIDMENQRNQREVENKMREGLRLDRARVQTGKISRFGLMELSRQRLRPALAETSYIPCPRCTGTGHIRSAESAALHILRILEEEAMKDNTAAVHTQVPVDVATFLLNEKRGDIQSIELRHKVNVLIIPNTHLETPQHQITRLRHEELNHEDGVIPSYKMASIPAEESARTQPPINEIKPPKQVAAIRGITPETPPSPKRAPSTTIGFIGRILGWLTGSNASADVAPTKEFRNDRIREGRNSGRRRKDNNRDTAAKATQPEALENKSNSQSKVKEESKKPREPRESRRSRPEGKSERIKETQISGTTGSDAVITPKDASTQNSTSTNDLTNQSSRRRNRRNGRRDRVRTEDKQGEQAANTNTSEQLTLVIDEGTKSVSAAIALETMTAPSIESLPETKEMIEESSESGRNLSAITTPLDNESSMPKETTPAATYVNKVSGIENASGDTLSSPIVEQPIVSQPPITSTNPAAEVNFDKDVIVSPVTNDDDIAVTPTQDNQEAVRSTADIDLNGLTMIETKTTVGAESSVSASSTQIKLGRARKQSSLTTATTESLVMVETTHKTQ